VGPQNKNNQDNKELNTSQDNNHQDNPSPDNRNQDNYSLDNRNQDDYSLDNSTHDNCTLDNHNQNINPSNNGKLKNKQNWLSLVLRFIPLVLIIIGCFILISNLTHYAKGYFAFLSPSSYDQTNETIEESTSESNNLDQTVNSNESTEEADIKLYSTPPKTGSKMGELYIPKLEVTLPIYEGTDEDELEKGVGHFAESVLPGEDDNCVLSGHRDTVFRKLGDIGEGDLLIVKTSIGEAEYKVKKIRIVEKDDKTVIVPKPQATLTVSTCYPFNYIGPAPNRYILVAYLSSKTIYNK
jgi:sortase A